MKTKLPLYLICSSCGRGVQERIHGRLRGRKCLACDSGILMEPETLSVREKFLAMRANQEAGGDPSVRVNSSLDAKPTKMPKIH